jgi:LysR family glycine cleavage system transcriptional activator
MLFRRDLPNLNDLRAFEAAAQAGGFTPAARHLNVGQPAISRRIALLEDWLGVRLFERRGPNLSLTRAGRELLPAVAHAMGVLEASCTAVRRRGPAGAVTASVSISFAGGFLMRRLSGFYRAHPDTEVQIVARYANELSDGSGADVAVYFNEDPAYAGPDRPIFLEDLIVVRSPAHRQAYGPIETPADLLRHQLLVLDSPAHRGDWTDLLAQAGLSPPPPRPANRVNNFSVYLTALAAGNAVGLAWRQLVEDDLASGRLEQPLALRLGSRRGFYLRHSGRREARLFAEWLIAEGAATEHAHPG